MEANHEVQANRQPDDDSQHAFPGTMFEQRLRLAMRREPPPLGLKARVLAQSKVHVRIGSAIRPGSANKWSWPAIFSPTTQRVLAATIPASLVLAFFIGGVAVYNQREERLKGELAREQVLTALRITSRTLDRVHNRLSTNP